MATASPATTIEDLHADMLTRALRHLDGPALAAASCANVHLRSLASQPDLWCDLCLATWPALHHPRLLRLLSFFPNSYRSFFSDAFPSPSPLTVIPPAAGDDEASLPSELISAVDLQHRGSPILSRVLETDTSTAWFRGAHFRLDALDPKDSSLPTLLAAATPEDLTLNWIFIDPHRRRAVRATSRRPVAIDKHWITGETVVRFATVLGDGCAIGVVATCVEETGQVREVSLTAECVDGVCLSGRDGLAVLRAAMEGSRRREEAAVAERRRWEEFSGLRMRRKEAVSRREQMVDLACAAVAAAGLLALFAVTVFR
ncbi:probable F-box protein At2g36090 [Musa acuminata AAA Group]|uniref:probable F-box protein At2g36090 n=1 Tax=Musa acuminata AAA Group TaxID=214697 RepID=UPI0031D85ADB